MIPNRSSSDEDLKRLQAMEQRRKRMIKNRESARRSRIRKLGKLDEFKALINHLKEENAQLRARLNSCHQSCYQLATENATLRDKQNPVPRVPLPLLRERINAASSSESELTVRFEEFEQLIEDYFGNPPSFLLNESTHYPSR